MAAEALTDSEVEAMFAPAINVVEPPNIDLSNRPEVQNKDGSHSTEDSISIGTDQGEVLIPQIVNGKRLEKADAIEHYKNTGEHLGIYKDIKSADAAADIIHKRNEPATDQEVEGWFAKPEAPKTSGAAAFFHGLAKSGAGVGAGWALASSLEPANVAAAATTGPFAPVTFPALNILEFLGGSLLANKLITKGEDALEPHANFIKDLKQADKEHPQAAQIGELAGMGPFAIRSGKGFASIVKNSESMSAAAKAIAQRVAGGAAGGAAMTVAQPAVDHALNAAGQVFGLTPEEVHSPKIKDYISNMAIGIALSGEVSKAKVEGKAEAESGGGAVPADTAGSTPATPMVNLPSFTETETARVQPVDQGEVTRNIIDHRKGLIDEAQLLGHQAETARAATGRVPGVIEDRINEINSELNHPTIGNFDAVELHNDLQGQAAILLGKADTLRKSGLPVPHTVEQQLENINGEIERVSPVVEEAGFPPSQEYQPTGPGRESSERAGITDPSESGTGMGARALREEGRSDLMNGADPNKSLRDFLGGAGESRRNVGVLVAARERLEALAIAAEEKNKRSPSQENADVFDQAFAALRKWDNDALAPARKHASESMKQFQDVLEEVNLSTYTGMRSKMFDINGRDFKPNEKIKAEGMVKEINGHDAALRNAINAVDIENAKAAPRNKVKITNDAELKALADEVVNKRIPC